MEYNTVFCCLLRMFWRGTIRRNLKMVLAVLMCRTAIWKVPVLRWNVFWVLGRVSLRLLGILWEFQKPEKEFLSSLLFDDVELVVVPQSPGHFLIGHIVTVLVVSPETRQSVGVDHSEHQVVLVLPSDVFLVTIVTQQLIHIVPQQSALWDTAVGFVQCAPWLLSTGQIKRLRDDSLCLRRAVNLVVKRWGDSC